MTWPGDDAPYLSVVTASRNDDHGGDMTRRMQIFVNALVAQARQHRLRCELVLVEWNPPPERPPLRDALCWPDDEGWCSVRIVTVPPELHRRHAGAERLPLFQMIAKNAGIRRARAPFVLATNVDLLFSEPLFAWLARRPLERGRVYRADRIDVDRDVPLEGLAEQLAWCETHVLRANRADGTWLVPPGARSQRVEDATLRTDDAVERGLLGRLVRLPGRTRRALLHTGPGRALRASRAAPALRAIWRGGAFVTHLALLPLRALRVMATPGLLPGERLDEMLVRLRRLPDLHTQACGDFLLLSREDWATLCGHPELEIFSFHLDSLTLYAAEAHGLREVRLPGDHVLYHVEHGAGWTPEGDAALYARMHALGVPILTFGALVARARALRRRPGLVSAGPDWGLARESLPEETLRPGGAPSLRRASGHAD